MSLTGNNILGGASGQTTGYDIDQSLRFNDDDGTYLSKAAPGAAGNLNNWTISVWLKRGQTTGLLAGSWEYQFFSQGDVSSNPVSTMSFYSSGANTDKIAIGMYGTSDSNLVCNWTSDSLYRDYSAWYHVVVKWDNTQSAAADILKVYVNGEVVSGTFTTSPSNGTTTVVNKDFKQFLGKYVYGTQPNWWDGYMAEYNFIDGQSLTSASFGETNSDTNQWVPIEYEGTYGTQGWYLNFSDSSSLGADSSGNGNNFTANVLAATDQVLDSPTNNFATLNPLYNWSTSTDADRTYSEGNLKGSSSATGWKTVASSQAIESGKWYWEATCFGDFNWQLGLARTDLSTTLNVGLELAGSYCVYCSAASTGGYFVNSTNTSDSNLVWAADDVIMCAYDDATGYFWLGKNGTWLNSGNPASGSGYIFTVISADRGNMVPAFSYYASTDGMRFNFGADSSFQGLKTAQGNGGVGEDFYYTPPTGFKALNTDNLDDPAIALPTDHFNTVLYAGDNATSRSITGIGFQPDFSWIKNRTSSCDHVLFDVVRGVADTAAGKQLSSNLTSAEPSNTNGHVKSFDSDGFSLRDGSSGGEPRLNTNKGSTNYASWNWKAGGAASSNGDGSKTSSVSANPTAGFSIVTYTGDGTGPDTVGHGLSSAPELIIVKNRSSVYDWKIYNETIGNTKYLSLNTSDAEATASTNWNDTSPTASVFTVNTNAAVNQDTSLFVAYCFHGVDGYSKVGSYTGNSATNGPFIYTGFRPAFIMVKLATAADGQWVVFDNKRDPDNPTGKVLYANINAADTDVSSYAPYDILSNGFKSRIPAGNGNEASYNSSGQTYIYLAFAESPFKTSNAR